MRGGAKEAVKRRGAKPRSSSPPRAALAASSKEGKTSVSGRRVDSSVSREPCVQRGRRWGPFQDESAGNRGNPRQGAVGRGGAREGYVCWSVINIPNLPRTSALARPLVRCLVDRSFRGSRNASRVVVPTSRLHYRLRTAPTDFISTAFNARARVYPFAIKDESSCLMYGIISLSLSWPV